METLGTLLSWVTWLGVFGVVGAVALFLLAPSVGQVLASLLSPIAKGVGEFVVWFFRDILWVGMKDMLDNIASVVFVIVAISVGSYFLSPKCDPKPHVDKAIADLRLNYKFIERTPAEKRVQRRKQDQAAPCWYCLW